MRTVVSKRKKNEGESGNKESLASDMKSLLDVHSHDRTNAMIPDTMQDKKCVYVLSERLIAWQAR